VRLETTQTAAIDAIAHGAGASMEVAREVTEPGAPSSLGHRQPRSASATSIVTQTPCISHAEVIEDHVPHLLELTDDLLRAVGRDFGHIRTALPSSVVRPTTPAEVVEAVRWARARGVPIAAQGRRHSVYGRGQAANGLVIDMSALDAVVSVDAGRVVVEGGATWRQVLETTLPDGLAPPVLPDYLDLSIGGTLAVGGIGAGTISLGAVTDHVLELEVVTGAGDLMHCSSSEDGALFDAVRAGLGQVALVVRATLALAPAPSAVRTTVFELDDLGDLLAEARRLASDPDVAVAAQGAVTPVAAGGWAHHLEVTTFESDPAGSEGSTSGTSSYSAFLGRFDAIESRLRASGQWSMPHPWLMSFVGESVVERVLRDELGRLEPGELGRFGQVSVNPVRADSVRTPLLRLPAEPLCFAVNFVHLPDSDDGGQIVRAVEANRACFERLREAGGVLYPVSALPMTGADWRRHFGPAFDLLAATRRRLDPDGLLTPGYEVFTAGRNG
jgi:cytokinin dehydrogenase